MDNAQLDALMKSLEAQIESTVNESLKEIQPKVLDKIKESAKINFYGSYSPTMYKRTLSLEKDSTYKIDFIKNGFKISSDYGYGNKSIFDIAEHGRSMGYWDRYPRDKNNKYDEYNRDSLFLTKAYHELNNGEVTLWLKNSLRSKGIDCR